MVRRPVSPSWVVLAVSFWLASAGNLALWRRLALPTTQEAGVAGAAGLFIIIWAALFMLLGLLAWRATLKPAASALLAVAAIASYFMLSYGLVIDAGMMTNALQTDPREMAGLASWKMLAPLGLLALLPGWLLWRQPVAYGHARRQAGRNLLLVLSGAVMLAAAVFLSFQPLASAMRNHKDLRYLINPLASLYAAGRLAARPWERDESVLVRIGEDARLAQLPAHAGGRPRVLLLVVGETARSDNFSINGYARATTPELERVGAVSFRNAWSCGTSTAASLPCMFSNLTRAGFDSRSHRYEGLLDVLQRAGLAVLWIDNQSGCKGVCDRVPSVSTAATAQSPFCSGGECLDEVMLEGLDERIAALDPVRVARGLVIVMHQMGSHGPAYHLRSPAAGKHFLPECRSAALQDCQRQEIVNAYDNSIAYTDHFLGRAVEWLRRREAAADGALLYVADHGESLGEGNLYLHGMPYAIAPDVQKHVPWVTWLADAFQRDSGLSASCLRAAREHPFSHDNYFHSVLGLMGVEGSVYQPSLDAYAPCRSHPEQTVAHAAVSARP